MTKDDDRDELLRDGERVRVPMFAMDAKSIRDANAVHIHRPGYRFSQKLMRDGDAARETIIDLYDQYDREVSEKWRTTDQKEGDSCTAPNGDAGTLQFVAGKLVCTPVAAAKTSDSKLLDADFDDGDLRELAYSMYDADLQNRWRGE